jgi:hypothetical protein
MHDLLPESLITQAKKRKCKLPCINSMHSTRAMAFTIKGIYYSNKKMNFENKAP